MQNSMVPFTGDETQIGPYIIICIIAVVLIIVLIIASVLSRKKAMAKLDGQEPELETVSLEDSETIVKEAEEESDDESEVDSEEDASEE